MEAPRQLGKDTVGGALAPLLACAAARHGGGSKLLLQLTIFGEILSIFPVQIQSESASNSFPQFERQFAPNLIELILNMV